MTEVSRSHQLASLFTHNQRCTKSRKLILPQIVLTGVSRSHQLPTKSFHTRLKKYEKKKLLFSMANSPKMVVALSGGVNPSVAAYLLKNKFSCRLSGLHMNNWNANDEESKRFCSESELDADDTRSVWVSRNRVAQGDARVGVLDGSFWAICGGNWNGGDS